MWNGNHPSIAIKRLPDAVAEKLIESGKDFDVEKISPQQYTKHHIFRCASKMHKEELKLFYYQEEAVQKWQQSNKRMLLEMATGCGKTRTAIGCIKYLID
jgi:type I site-specific restriction endonuclease